MSSNEEEWQGWSAIIVRRARVVRSASERCLRMARKTGKHLDGLGVLGMLEVWRFGFRGRFGEDETNSFLFMLYIYTHVYFYRPLVLCFHFNFFSVLHNIILTTRLLVLHCYSVMKMNKHDYSCFQGKRGI